MDARVASGPPELHHLAVAERAKRSELRAQLRVVGDGADGAVHVELGVAPGIAAVLHGQGDQLVARGVQGLAPGLQELPSLRETSGSRRAGPPCSRLSSSAAPKSDAVGRCAGEGLLGAG